MMNHWGKRERSGRLAAGLLATAVVISGCDSGDKDASTATAGDKAAPAQAAPTAAGSAVAATGAVRKTFTVGIAGGNYAIESARAQYEGLARAVADRGMKFRFADASLDINKQVSQIDQLTSDGVDAIVVNLIGDPNAVAGPIKRAKERGIKIFSLGGPLPGVEGVIAEADLPNTTMGALSARYMCEKTGGSGQIAMIMAIEIPVLAERWNSFEAELNKGCPDVKIVDRQRAIPDDAPTARALAEQILIKHPDIKGIWAMGDAPALGAGLAVKAAGKKIIVTGMNGETNGVNGIKQGVISVTWDIQPTEIGVRLGNIVADVLEGKQQPGPLVKFTTPEDQVTVWDATTIASYKPYDQRVTYPKLQ
ncbi:sugar ABC transporter substrate-binding protein [Sorangium sp. So ce726]|uniref:sugar ABC transporter substrate-binding protein n=1 Tax=Sorangium sp. So ce726 TaxID=3133319 RepID=UPI003F6421CB